MASSLSFFSYKIRLCSMQVHDLVMAAILAAEPELHSSARMHVPHRTNCFEVIRSLYMLHW